MEKFFGKYRAKVLDNKDPKKMGRLKVSCPTIYGDYESPWCLPCSPYAEASSGFITLPKVGTWVWIEFEEGSSQLPIWVGSWWKENSLTESDLDSKRYFKTKDGNLVVLDDKNDKIEVKHKSGTKITIVSNLVTINSDVKIEGKLLVNKSASIGGTMSVGGDVTVKGDVIADNI